MTLAAYFHDLNPIVWRISGDFAVRWYGLSYVAGFIICWAIMWSLARRKLIAVPADRVDVALMWIVLGVLVGGRLGYALVYDPALFTGFTKSVPWWDLLAINKGGMASHGGMVGAVAACWWVSRGFRREDGTVVGRCSMLHVMDVLALAAPFGLFLGRVANFVNGELLGKVVSGPGKPGPWWTVQFPQELKGWVYDPSTQTVVRDAASHAPELDAPQQQTLVDLARQASQPGDTWAMARDRLIENAGEHRAGLELILSSRHPSQLYQAIAEGIVLGIVVWGVWRWWKRAAEPGVTAGVWLAMYGVLRIATEVWRLPDAQFAAGRPWGLSRGQWFSAAMVGAGLAVAWWAIRKAKRNASGASGLA